MPEMRLRARDSDEQDALLWTCKNMPLAWCRMMDKGFEAAQSSISHKHSSLVSCVA